MTARTSIGRLLPPRLRSASSAHLVHEAARPRPQIFAFPHWSDNPYLNMLYLAARADGWVVRKSTLFESLLAQLEADARTGDVIHVHWTAPIVQRALTLDEARERLERFQRAVDGALEQGVHLVWTMHNVLPHEMSYVDEEVALARFIADRAQLIHVLSPATARIAAPHFAVPDEKIVQIPHASYAGIYDESMTRDEARASFSLDSHAIAVLFFGQMRPYKGLDILFAALDEASAERRDLVLLLAGKTHPDDLGALEAMLPQGVRVIRDHSYVPDGETQRWFRAADVAVLPYRNILNSGSIHLAATYGLPTILPRQDHLVEQFAGQGWVRFFDLDEPAKRLARLLIEFDDVDGRASVDALRLASEYTPFDMSRRYARALSDITR